MSIETKRRELNVDDAIERVGEFGLAQKIQTTLVRCSPKIPFRLKNLQKCLTTFFTVWRMLGYSVIPDGHHTLSKSRTTEIIDPMHPRQQFYQ